jgi:hypothetical protein
MRNQEHADSHYITDEERGTTPCINHSKGAFYQFGVSIAGIGVSAQTTNNSTTTQCIAEGTQTTSGHWVWSHYANPSDINNPLTDFHVIYSS